MEHDSRPYVNLPPMLKTRSTSHLSPTGHYRSISYEDTPTTPSTSIDSEVKFRIENVQNEKKEIPNKMYVAAFEYQAAKDDELDLPLGAMIKLITTDTNEEGWYKGELDQKVGLFPSNYVRLIGEEENLNEFNADDIMLPDPNKSWNDFQIGRGATATVYKVDIIVPKKDSQSDLFAGTIRKFDKRKAALKRFNSYSDTIRKDDKRSPTIFEVLKREANLVNGLHHPNIVRLLGICLEKHFGLLLELCEGSSLRQVYTDTKTRGLIPFRVLIDWAQQIASGMEYLIKQGYVHRDLKADNVLVKEEVCLCMDEKNYEWCPRCGRRPLDQLQLKITDFGVTRKVTADANRSSAVGTYAWLAPEAFRDGLYSEASDVWSFGVVLWELLSREEPYQGYIPMTIAFQISNNGQTLAIDENCPEKWKNIMQQCWELEPSKRPNFQFLIEYFKDYSKDMQDESMSGHLNSQLERVQSIIAQDLQSFYSNDQKNKLESLFQSLYSPGGIERKNRESIAPETKARKNKNYKNKKPEISKPVGEVKHLLSIVENGADKNLKLYYTNDRTPGGTLPRTIGRQHAISASSPDLNQSIELGNNQSLFINDHSPTSTSKISRQKAIRKKNRNSHTSSHGNVELHNTPASSPYNSGDNDGSVIFARIDRADEVEGGGTLKDQKKDGALSKIMSKLQRKSHKRDSHEDDDRFSAGSVTSRSSSTTSSNRHISPFLSGQQTRGAAALSFLDGRARAASAIDCLDETKIPKPRHKVSPSDKTNPIKVANRSSRDTEMTSRPAHLPTFHRKSALDQPIPPSPNSPETAVYPMPVGESRRTTSSVDGLPNYELLVAQTPQTSSTSSNHSGGQSIMSSYIPSSSNEPTHFEMHNGIIMGSNTNHNGGGNTSGGQAYYPVGGGCDDYILVAGTHSSSASEVNNTPYSEISTPVIGRNVFNPQYYHCKPNKTPPIKSAPIRFSSEQTMSPAMGRIRISDSSFSLNEPPDIPAPPPPPSAAVSLSTGISMSPPSRSAPAIPPREGKISLETMFS